MTYRTKLKQSDVVNGMPVRWKYSSEDSGDFLMGFRKMWVYRLKRDDDIGCHYWEQDGSWTIARLTAECFDEWEVHKGLYVYCQPWALTLEGMHRDGQPIRTHVSGMKDFNRCLEVIDG